MAGVNKSLKAGSVVFKKGDDADGMYIVRKGELLVYLEQGDKEIVLARIPEGGIVGEMALFEKMPRSASVKTSMDSEITHISQADFTALMKQIPKWFVGLMSALSGRLRSTNDRLKNLENPGQLEMGNNAMVKRPMANTIRLLHTLDLIWHRDGARDGKEWTMSRKNLEEQLVQIFGEAPVRVQALIDALSSEGVLISKQDSYKNVHLSLPNRAALTQFTQFLDAFNKNSPKTTIIPEQTMQILKLAGKMAAKAPYETFTVTLEELSAEATAAGLDPSGWARYAASIVGYGEGVKSTKTSEKSGVGLRILRAEVAAVVRNASIFNKIAERHLD